jgi:rSAM/selenodomain-associated transferase 2
LESERSQVAPLTEVAPLAPSTPPARISVIVPALNEGQRIADCLRIPLKSAFEVIVVDGGSTDATAAIARVAGAKVIKSTRGRAAQMNAGAALATGELLLFLHADVHLPMAWAQAVTDACAPGRRCWGRFDVALDSSRASLRMVGFMMNWRSRLSGIATGDQAIFVRHLLWRQVGGYAPIALMEDIELCRRLKRAGGAPACLRLPVQVSARRWLERGVARTILNMWWLRALYFLGATPQSLHARYYSPSVKSSARDQAR